MAFHSVPRPLVACLLLAAGSLSPARADIVDTFNLNNAGWGLIDNFFTPAPWLPTGGNPDGHLNWVDSSTPLPDAFFTAPTRYGGNQAAATSLRFDMKRSAIGSAPTGPDIVILSAYGNLTRKLPAAPGTGWTSYNLSLLDPTGWMVASGFTTLRPATALDMRSTLARMSPNLSSGSIYLRSQWNNAPGESGSLDNVNLVGGKVGGLTLPPGLFNIDVRNTTQSSARGLRMVLPGDARFSRLYTGQPWLFDQIRVIPQDPAPLPGDPGLQSVWWHNTVGPTAPPGQIFHPGFTLSNGAYLADMYWTDEHGDAIENGHISVASTDLIYDSVTGEASLNLANTLIHNFGPGGAGMMIEEQMMYLRPTPFDLADLNRDNAELAAGLIPIPGAMSSAIPMGGVLNMPLPGTYADGDTIVFRYKTTAPTSGGEITYFAQFTIPAPGAIGLLAGLGALAMRRRRRPVASFQ